MTGNYSRDAIEAAKRSLPLPDLLVQLGFPDWKKKNPLRDDRCGNSFTVTQKGDCWLWYEHFLGVGGDQISYLEQLYGLNRRDATNSFLSMARGYWAPPPEIRQIKRPTDTEGERRKPVLPSMDQGTRAKWDPLSKLRGFAVDGIGLAVSRGLLRFSHLRGFDSWLVTDCSQWLAQARRLDGCLWEHIGDKKSWTLPGCRGGWTLGAEESKPFEKIAMVEGGPDFVAAHCLICAEGKERSIGVLAVLGVSNNLTAEAITACKGKLVRIIGHTDQRGKEAVAKWANQLPQSTVETFSLEGLIQANGKSVEDLNDALHMGDLGREELGGMLP
jgi:hypothetical protein